MYLLVNDYSLNGQFNDLDEFFYEIKTIFIPMLKHIKYLNINILKSYDTYSRYVTKNKTISDILYIKGDAEITILKSYLVSVFAEDPYWNDDIKTKAGSCYYYNNLAQGLNCFTEALERNYPLISFPSVDYKAEKIIVYRDNEEFTLLNCFNNESLLNILYEKYYINETYYMEHFYEGTNIRFCIISGHNYTQEFFDIGVITHADRIKIIEDVKQVIVHIINKTDTGNLVKNLGNKLWEVRSDISDKRICRIFYVLYKKEIILLNGFIKKSQKTPKTELELARSLLKVIISNDSQ